MKLLSKKRFTGKDSDFYKLTIGYKEKSYHVTYDIISGKVNVHEWYLLDESELNQLSDYVKSTI